MKYSGNHRTSILFFLLLQCNQELLTSVEAEDGSSQQQQCPYFLPYKEQGWPSFMGIQGDSTFNHQAEMKIRQKRDNSGYGR